MLTAPLSSCLLKNGLTLLCWDQSKKIATDRWTVCVMAKITIPVAKKWFGNNSVDEETFRQIRKVLGESIVFQKKYERQFIGDDLKDQLIVELCNNAVDTGVKYLSHDNFAAKYILKVFADQQRRRYR